MGSKQLIWCTTARKRFHNDLVFIIFRFSATTNLTGRFFCVWGLFCSWLIMVALATLVMIFLVFLLARMRRHSTRRAIVGAAVGWRLLLVTDSATRFLGPKIDNEILKWVRLGWNRLGWIWRNRGSRCIHIPINWYSSRSQPEMKKSFKKRNFTKNFRL